MWRPVAWSVQFSKTCAERLIEATQDIRVIPGTPKIPGPAFSFPFGNMTGPNSYRADVLGFGPAMAKQYGPIYRIWFKGPLVFVFVFVKAVAAMLLIVIALVSVLTEADDIKQFYADQVYHPKSGEVFDITYPFNELLGECLGMMYGDRWRTVRPMMEHEFTPRYAGEFIRRTDFIPAIEKWVKDAVSAGGTFDVMSIVGELPFWLMVDIIYGHLTDTEKCELEELKSAHSKLFEATISNPWSKVPGYKFIPWAQLNRQLKNYQANWEAFNLRYYQRASEQNIECLFTRVWKNVVEVGSMNQVEVCLLSITILLSLRFPFCLCLSATCISKSNTSYAVFPNYR
jgi:cytochrome P450